MSVISISNGVARKGLPKEDNYADIIKRQETLIIKQEAMIKKLWSILDMQQEIMLKQEKRMEPSRC